MHEKDQVQTIKSNDDNEIQSQILLMVIYICLNRGR